MRLLLVDNFDSFTWNLAQALGAAGATVEVRRNDAVDLGATVAGPPDALVLSPGPGRADRPADFGACGPLLDALPTVPTLGVCLGHQGIGLRHGARLVRAPRVMHGKVSAVIHDGVGLFEGLPSPFPAMRYHSWLLHPGLPPGLRTTARTEDGLVMALEHSVLPRWGVQFHPESVGTPLGPRVLANFLRLAQARRPTAPARC
jgi:para-aminobenzoate synthetase